MNLVKQSALLQCTIVFAYFPSLISPSSIVPCKRNSSCQDWILTLTSSCPHRRGRSWCALENPEFTVQMLRVDIHSQPVRTNGVAVSRFISRGPSSVLLVVLCIRPRSMRSEGGERRKNKKEGGKEFFLDWLSNACVIAAGAVSGKRTSIRLCCPQLRCCILVLHMNSSTSRNKILVQEIVFDPVEQLWYIYSRVFCCCCACLIRKNQSRRVRWTA